MKLKDFINKLRLIYNKYGDTDVYMWNDSQMRHVPVNDVKFPLADDFVEGLANDKEYVDDFNMILESVIIR